MVNAEPDQSDDITMPPPPTQPPSPPPTEVFIVRNETGSFHYEPVARVRDPGSHQGQVVVRWPGLYTELFSNCSNVPADLPWMWLRDIQVMAGPGLFFRRATGRSNGRWYRCPYVDKGCHYGLGTCRGRPNRVRDALMPRLCSVHE